MKHNHIVTGFGATPGASTTVPDHGHRAVGGKASQGMPPEGVGFPGHGHMRAGEDTNTPGAPRVREGRWLAELT